MKSNNVLNNFESNITLKKKEIINTAKTQIFKVIFF